MGRPGEAPGGPQQQRPRGGAVLLEERGGLRTPRPGSRGVAAGATASPTATAGELPEWPSRPSASPPARPVAHLPQPLETATPQQRRRSSAAGVTVLGSRCVPQGTVSGPEHRRPDSPAKVIGAVGGRGAAAAAHFSLCAAAGDGAASGEEADEGLALPAMYRADWCNPALFAPGSGGSPRKARAGPRASTGAQSPIVAVAQTPREEDAEAAAGGTLSVARERELLLAAIGGLSAAADAALRRAEAAEAAVKQGKTAEASASTRRPQAAKVLSASGLVTTQRTEAAAENMEDVPPVSGATHAEPGAFAKDVGTAAARRALEARIRDSVMAEVRDAVRAAAEEATAELRAAAEEIRRLRAGTPTRGLDCAGCTREAAAELRAAVEELRHLRGGWRDSAVAGGEVEEATALGASCEQHWAGRASRGGASSLTSGGSSPAQPNSGSQVSAPEGTASEDAAEIALFGMEESTAALAGSVEFSRSTSQEDAIICHARSVCEAEPLRVRDVVSKLERQREQSTVRAPRAGPPPSAAAPERASRNVAWAELPRRVEPQRAHTALGGTLLTPAPAIATPAGGPTPLRARWSSSTPAGTPPAARSFSAAPARCAKLTATPTPKKDVAAVAVTPVAAPTPSPRSGRRLGDREAAARAGPQQRSARRCLATGGRE